jgi:acetyltransferase
MEIDEFLSKGRINFPDEVAFGNALTKIYITPASRKGNIDLPELDVQRIRNLIDEAENGYLTPEKVQDLLDAAGISRAKEGIATSLEAGIEMATQIGFPLVMKVVGPVHKTDVGGVVLNIKNSVEFTHEFNRMMLIKDVTAILLQPMLTGTELYIGAKNEGSFGHLVMCGLGGIFIEVLNDVEAALAPIHEKDALNMISRLHSYKLFEGIRGKEPINQQKFAEMISRISALCMVAPEIFEMDLNPLLAAKNDVIAVDCRIRIDKNFN